MSCSNSSNNNVQLSIDDISCRYETDTVINSLSLKVKKNEIVAIIGPSGCGKSTLFKAISGLLPIEQGLIKIGSIKANSANFTLPSEQRKIGMIFQDYALFPHLNVAENIAFGIKALTKAQQTDRINKLLKLVKLSEYINSYPHELSGGQQQRVAIARALAYKPEIVLLDEAFSNLDSQSRFSLLSEMRAIFKQQKISAILVTHSKEEAFNFADRVAVMNDGKIIQEGAGDQLYHNPKNKFVADFLGKANYLPILKSSQNSFYTLLGEIFCSDIHQINANATEIIVRPENIKLSLSSAGEYQIIDKQFFGAYWHYQVQSLTEEEQMFIVSDSVDYSVAEKVELKIERSRVIAW